MFYSALKLTFGQRLLSAAVFWHDGIVNDDDVEVDVGDALV